MCNHKTAIVIHKRKGYTYMLCTGTCRQPYVMQQQTNGRYERRDDVAQFFTEREAEGGK